MRRETAIILAVDFALEVALGTAPRADCITWALENFPVWAGFVVVAVTDRRFPLSRLCLVSLASHCAILAVGGHYTSSR